MDAEWQWHRTLFGGSAWYYRAGRFPYPAELATAFREVLRRVSPGGQFCEVSEPIQLIIWTRPAD